MLSISIILSCILLVAAVLMQNSKGGLQSQTVKVIAGVKQGTRFMERATYTLAILVMVFVMLS